MRWRSIISICLFLTVMSCKTFSRSTLQSDGAASQPASGKATNVWVLGIDGLGGFYLQDWMDKHPNSNFEKLRQRSLYTFDMHNITPTGSGPNWASMLTGVKPSVHKVLCNMTVETRGRFYNRVNDFVDEVEGRPAKFDGTDAEFLAANQQWRKDTLKEMIEEYETNDLNFTPDPKGPPTMEDVPLEPPRETLVGGKVKFVFGLIGGNRQIGTMFDHVTKYYSKRSRGNQMPERKVFHEWDEFGHLLDKDSLTSPPIYVKPVHGDHHGEKDVLDHAIHYFIKKKDPTKPSLVFTHVDFLDHIGHENGWNTQAYRDGISQVDELIGRVLDYLKDTETGRNTLLILSSDHGGINRIVDLNFQKGWHNRNETEVRRIPFMATGPGITGDRLLQTPLGKGKRPDGKPSILDIAPTVLGIFRVDQPTSRGWDENAPLFTIKPEKRPNG